MEEVVTKQIGNDDVSVAEPVETKPNEIVQEYRDYFGFERKLEVKIEGTTAHISHTTVTGTDVYTQSVEEGTKAESLLTPIIAELINRQVIAAHVMYKGQLLKWDRYINV